MKVWAGLAIFALVLACVSTTAATGPVTRTIPFGATAQADVEGTWTLVMNTGRSQIEGTLELEQDGRAIEGAWLRRGDAQATTTAVVGEVAEETLTFSFTEEIPAEMSGRIDFVGEIDEQGVMAGTFTTEEGATGEWTARRN
jgi:hypothetical protein